MNEWKSEALNLASEGKSWRKIAKLLNKPKSTVSDFLRSNVVLLPEIPTCANKKGAKILFLDIETKYIVFQGWGMFNQNFSLEQIEEDWSILSFSYKWAGDEDTSYYDISDHTEDELLSILHTLLSEADFVVGHNARKFDVKKVKARMVARGFKPFSPVRVIDTLEICKQEFAFTSNKLAYVTHLLCKRNKKLSHNKFAGHVLWKEFVRGNPEAVQEMREYNMVDVDSLEELYNIIAPWSSKLPVFELYDEEIEFDNWEEDGYHLTNLGKYRRYRHKVTGQWRRGRTNLLSREERAMILGNVV